MSNVTRKNRDSNIELLRLVAMFLVLVVHADFFSLGAPTQAETLAAPASAFSRFFFEAVSIICVDVFVLISGWFGIRPSAKSFCNFIFQCFFFSVGIYVVMLALGLTSLSIRGLAGCFFLLKWNWFVKAYIGLYILSPVLNAFIDHAEERTFRIVLLGFFLFQSIYAWISNGAVFFEHGYSTMSFIGLYLLARYVKIYLMKRLIFTPPPCRCLLVFSAISLLLTVVSFFLVRIGLPGTGQIYSYVNPLVIVSAFSLLLLFNGLRIKSNFINWCAASSFAIFLLHANPNLTEPYFKHDILHLYNSYEGVECLLMILLYLIAVGVIAIVIDQIRKFLWRKIAKRYFG